MTLVEILDLASAAYPDDFLKNYYDARGRLKKPKGDPDPLAGYIVAELITVFNPDDPPAKQLADAASVLTNSAGDIASVASGLRRAAKKAAK